MHFFPSRRISVYMAKLFVTRSLAVLAMLVLILMTLDLLGESGKILSVAGNDQGDVLSYIGMRAPQIIARFLPFSVLLGTIITFATLSQNSEVVAMKAAGLSAHQILAPMFVASLAVAVFSFAFADAVVAPNTAKLKVWQAVDYGPVPADTGVRTNVWVREGQDLINARTVIGTGDTTVLGGVSLYLRANGGLRQVMKADEARYSGDGWQLKKVTSFDVATTEANVSRTSGLLIRNLRGISQHFHNKTPRWYDKKVPSGWGHVEKPNMLENITHFFYEKLQFANSSKPGTGTKKLTKV